MLDMVEAMRPVITFLNQLDAETASDEVDQVLGHALRQAKPSTLRSITRTGHFEQPARTANVGPPMTNIQFRRPRAEVEDLQEAMPARSARDVGEKAFDLAYRRYVEEA